MKTTLEQWKAFQAVIDYGGYAQAAQALHRSQSSVSYLVAKLQDQLGVSLLEVEGRKAQLTEVGRVLLSHAQSLLTDAESIEQRAQRIRAGWEPELRLVVDVAFPTSCLAVALDRFTHEAPLTRIQLTEVVLSGAEEAVLEHEADVMVGAYVPPGYLGSVLIQIEFIALARFDHALHQLQRDVTESDLKRYRHIVVRDSGTENPRDEGWQGSVQRWTVSSLETSLALVAGGLGFAWLPRHMAHRHIDQGVLKPLPMARGQSRMTPLYLVLGQGWAQAGPATRLLAQVLEQAAAG